MKSSFSVAGGAVLFLSLLCSLSVGAIEQPVQIEQGLLQGVPGDDPIVTVFRGIPYAAAPVGELRWKAPQPPASWDGVRLADSFGDMCPQPAPSGSNRTRPMSEDCLTLNIWTAAASADEARPVYVWIYGGGFSGGSGSNPAFDGEYLARKGLVVVTFNYRLGALGFLATPELSAESGHEASGNYGLLDDIAVLQWVRDNIAAFGGDPGRVTIGGQSAGGGSVGFLSMSPLAKGLFANAIVESHSRYPRDLELRYLSVSHRMLDAAESAGIEFLEGLGVDSPEELRALPWEQVLGDSRAIDADVYTGSSAKPPLFRPVIDGWVIPRNYTETYARGSQNDVGYLTGNNRDETGAIPETSFQQRRSEVADNRAGAPPVIVTLDAYLAAAREKFGPMADEFLELYPAADDDEAALASNAAARDNSRISTYLWAGLWTQHAARPVFTYFWTHRPPGPGHDMRGAYHGSEIAYSFGNAGEHWTDEDFRVSGIMSSYWANFIATGNPNGEGLPEWPVYDSDMPRVMELGENFAPIAIAEPARLDFWKRFFALQDPW